VTARRCPDCGVAEERLIIDGKPYLNLDPISGRCLSCLTNLAHAAVREMDKRRRRDVKLAQLPAHDDED
jgi:hypothetical protein